MYKLILIKERFKLHVLKRLRVAYPLEESLVEDESGFHSGIQCLSYPEVNGPESEMAVSNALLSEQTICDGLWLICMPHFGYEYTKMHF
ncbi:hypothetical protein [Klebsiella aerogenes]|uniref:hypothetical protein n=1 Tax=Klebsiella aerogenes TaxID=548 RepID=UPI001F427653|nr:hypothetical protein [Klebsiella aerogenes]